jgi:hypothetical protein
MNKRKFNYTEEGEEFKAPPKVRKGEDTPMNCLLSDVRNTQKALKKLEDITVQYENLLKSVSAREAEIEAEAQDHRLDLDIEWENLENEKFLITTLKGRNSLGSLTF